MKTTKRVSYLASESPVHTVERRQQQPTDEDPDERAETRRRLIAGFVCGLLSSAVFVQVVRLLDYAGH